MKEVSSKSSNELRHELEEDFQAMQQNIGGIARVGLWVVGAGIVGFALTKKLIRRKKSGPLNKEEAAQLPARTLKSTLGEIIRSAVLTFLLSILKEKIAQMIENYYDKQKDDASPTTPTT